jgi:predicted HNH restriction endonuclease
MKSGRFLLKIIDKLNDLKFNLNRTLSEIKNKESILSAISEYDKIGGYAFLNRYGFDPSLKYFLYYNNKLYDSKAIVGVSYRYEYPTEEYLSSNEFSGGQDTVVALLKNLEFTVLEKSITTACYLALKKINKESSIEEIKEKILDEKLYDFGAQDINDVIRVQIERYCDNVERKQQHNRKLFHKIDTSIYTLIEFLKEHNINENEVNDVEIKYESATEGEKKFKFTSFYERDSKLRKRAIQYHGTTCYSCGFNFEEFYGEYAKDYIHIHHTKPLFETSGTQEVDPIKDLVPVCANCHSIIHRRKNETKSIDEVKEMIRMQRLI